MRFVSWNVNGLRAALKKGFMEAFKELDADAFCLQETKMQEGQAILDLPGYEQYFYSAEKKGYSGTAIFTRIKPLSVTYGIGIEEHDHEGRVITMEYEDLYLVTVYTPNSKNALARLDYRMRSCLTCVRKNPSPYAATSTSHTRRLTSRTRRATGAMRDLQMRSAVNSRSSSARDLSIPSVPCTLTRQVRIRGGRTCAMRVRRTRDGASTTSSSRRS